jgi:hypothetical protein
VRAARVYAPEDPVRVGIVRLERQRGVQRFDRFVELAHAFVDRRDRDADCRLIGVEVQRLQPGFERAAGEQLIV